ncbi:pentatricopeptide repeat-containing protein At3g61360 isoform X3 [Telopea speciosissima]|uniref:pentatricopeptide repeat-containing protein At3g61360 isoform X3 n=1 Tax=Telopea speciosissima TaxID=54955 RepID=UPI001CC80E85|nr:pentatricopeptide repeat-containing protein At3g61360 isoform X3 [Telopea speciosissima]
MRTHQCTEQRVGKVRFVRMNLVRWPKRPEELIHFSKSLISALTFSSKSSNPTPQPSEFRIETDRITKLINDHPFPDLPLQPFFIQHIQPSLLSTALVENVLGRLFSGHSNGLKAFEFFKFSLNHSHCFSPSSDSFEKALHILTRMRSFDMAWELMEEIRQKHPSLLTLKSMSIFLSKLAKFGSFEDTLEAFERMEREVFSGRRFGVEEFNVLLRAFCTQRQMKEVRAVFQKMYPRFSPNTQTMNILLLGFKESGDVTSVELFYHEMVRRGFKPNVVTYNIRIDAYCKKGCFGDGLRLLEEMERVNCFPTIETITTLIHGAGIARNLSRARQLFEEIPLRNLRPDIGVYNALIATFIRARDVESAIGLMDEMEELGLKRSDGLEGVCKMYQRLVERNFVPKMRTVVMLMKFFCENRRPDLGLDLWGYLVERGCCPHGHALDLLVTGLCSHGRGEEAYECSKQVLERGRHLSEGGFHMLERFLVQAEQMDKLRKLDHMIKKLQTVLPPSRGHALGLLDPTIVN